MSTRQRKPPAARQVPFVEFASYTGTILRALAKSADKFGEVELAAILETAAKEAERVEEEARLMKN